jgi:hypothetical protein
MKPGEYDALIKDPSDFWLRIYMPPRSKLPSLPLTLFWDVIGSPAALLKTTASVRL